MVEYTSFSYLLFLTRLLNVNMDLNGSIWRVLDY